MPGLQKSDICSGLFKRFCVLMLASECMFGLMTFVVNNCQIFQPNSEAHKVNTRHKHDLHRPFSTLIVYQKDIFYAGIKLCN
jgi:hypothetical protein